MGPGTGRGQVADKRVVRFKQRLWPGRRKFRFNKRLWPGWREVRSRQSSWAGGRQDSSQVQAELRGRKRAREKSSGAGKTEVRSGQSLRTGKTVVPGRDHGKATDKRVIRSRQRLLARSRLKRSHV